MSFFGVEFTPTEWLVLFAAGTGAAYIAFQYMARMAHRQVLHIFKGGDWRFCNITKETENSIEFYPYSSTFKRHKSSDLITRRKVGAPGSLVRGVNKYTMFISVEGYPDTINPYQPFLLNVERIKDKDVQALLSATLKWSVLGTGANAQPAISLGIIEQVFGKLADLLPSPLKDRLLYMLFGIPIGIVIWDVLVRVFHW